MSNHEASNRVCDALRRSQNDSVRKIEQLEARIADLNTNLTDPSNSCKERKKLRFVKGKVLEKLELEHQRLLETTNALSLSEGTTRPRPDHLLGIGSPYLPDFVWHTPPMSPFMSFPMSPVQAMSATTCASPLFSPASTAYFSPVAPWFPAITPFSPVFAVDSFGEHQHTSESAEGVVEVDPHVWLLEAQMQRLNMASQSPATPSYSSDGQKQDQPLVRRSSI